MTTYFTAPDGHDEPTLWAREDEQLVSILRRCDLPYPHHWDELVARVIAGNPDPKHDHSAIGRWLLRCDVP